MAERPNSKLIRIYCDGEMTPEQLSDFERQLASDPQMREAVEAERAFQSKLRSCVGRCLGDSQPAPAGLLESIRSSWQAETEQATEPVIAGRIDGRTTPAGQGAGRFLRSPQRANIFAVAATLALVLGAVLFGIFGRPIDDVRPPQTTDLVAKSAEFASGAHDEKSASTRKVDLDAQARDIARAEQQLSDHLGVPVKVFDLNDLGYEFIGAWKSDLPVSDRSGHIMYRSTAHNALKPMVSVFVAPYGKCQGVCSQMESGKWECAGTQRECRHSVLYSTDKKLIYFLVCCKEGDLERLMNHMTQVPAARSR